jgi:FlaA1/EpsC-like NDP-sugar epimerase
MKGLRTENVVIYGAELSSVSVKSAIKNNTEKIYNIKAFIDDKFQYKNKAIDGIPVITTEGFKLLHKKTKINRLIVASLLELGNDKADIFDFCVNENIEIQKYLNFSSLVATFQVMILNKSSGACNIMTFLSESNG